ncbi:MAG: 50S ribosomal protein L15 [Microbacteriaceae bacterium]|nr:MAG: 50S ribosomal protein L15 [Microbacteriaceae bacterium]
MPEDKDTAAKSPAQKSPAQKSTAQKSTAEKKATAPKKAAAKAAAPDKPAAEKKAADKAPAKKASAKDASAASASATSAASDAKASAKKAPAPSAGSVTGKAEPAQTREHVLKVHHLRPAPGAKKDRTRVGRGEGSKGKTAGRGTKGTKARYQVRPGFQGGQLPFHMRAPKLRGFKNPFRVEYQVVNLQKLAELYPAGGDVTITDLVQKGAVRKNEKVKVLGTGDIAVKLNVAVDKVSGSAEQKIVAAGGSVN